MYYVYIHTNKINNKKYCGITSSIERRWRSGGIEYKPHSKDNQNRYFWKAIEKYGWDNFTHEIILEVETQEEAWQQEIRIIKELDLTNREKGYNIATGGNGGLIYEVHPKGMLGKQHSEETRKRLSEANKGEKNYFFGKNLSALGVHPKGMLGKQHSEEVKKRISETQKGKVVSQETREKIRIGLTGIKRSEETKKKISENKKALAQQEGYRANCSKWVKVEYPDGKIETYKSIKQCQVGLGISDNIYRRINNTNECFNPRLKKQKHLKGIKIFTIDDTEVNN